MKNLFLSLVLMLVCITYSYGQKNNHKILIPFDSISQKFTYLQITDAPNKSASMLYKAAKAFDITKYSDEKFVIDSLNTQLLDLGSFSVTVTMNSAMMKIPYTYTVLYSMDYSFKDNKYKLKVTNIKLSQNAQGTTQEQTLEAFEKQVEEMGMGKNMMRKFAMELYEKIDFNMQQLFKEVRTNLLTDTKSNNDW